MVFCFPSTPTKLAMTVSFFITSASIFAFAAHQSYLNVAPQQARIKARNEFVEAELKRKYGDKFRKPYPNLNPHYQMSLGPARIKDGSLISEVDVSPDSTAPMARTAAVQASTEF